MLLFKNTNPLLQAILQRDLPQVQLLSGDEKLRFQKDHLGFTPLEIAKLLDYKDCVHILEPSPQKTFRVMHEGDTTPLEYSVELLQKVFGIRYLPYLRFTNYEVLQHMMSQCPFILRTCIGKENRLLAEKYHHEISTGYVANSVIKYIDDHIGYGLFAGEDMAPNTYVGEYTGLVRRLYRSHPDHNPYCFHYLTRFWSVQYYVIDAFWQGNEMRFINHSAEPNLNPICLVDRHLLHTAFVTNQAIKAGTELTFDYGPDFWRKIPNR